jgi:uncharacterized membrane-anchored protein
MLSKNKLIFLIATIQVLFFSSWYYLESKKLNEPTSKIILVKTVPVDPRDFLSGNYFILSYEFSNFENYANQSEKIRTSGEKIQALLLDGDQYKNNETEIYVVLKKNNLWYIPDYFSLEKPSIKDDEVLIKGKYNPYIKSIAYGIEKFFINENRKEPKMGDKVEVTLIVGNDLTPKIKNVIINGIPVE